MSPLSILIPSSSHSHSQINNNSFRFILSFFILTLFLSFPHHSNTNVILKQQPNNSSPFQANSFKLLFMNNSFNPFSSQIVVLSYPLTQSSSANNNNQSLHGRIALIVTPLDSINPYNGNTPSYQMIVQLKELGCIGVVFFQTNANDLPFCCKTPISNDWSIPSTVIETSNAVHLFSILNINIDNTSNVTFPFYPSSNLSLWMNQSQLSDFETYSQLEYKIEYNGLLTTLCACLIIFIFHRLYGWCVSVKWNMSKIPRLLFLTFMIELIGNTLKIIDFSMIDLPIPLYMLNYLSCVFIPLQVMSIFLMALFWFENVNSVSPNNQHTFLDRIKYPVSIFILILMVVMLIGNEPSLSSLYNVAYVILLLINVALIVFYMVTAFQLLRFLRSKKVEGMNKKTLERRTAQAERMTWNVVGFGVCGFIALLFAGIWIGVTTYALKWRMLMVMHFGMIGMSFFTIRLFAVPDPASSS